jgi:SAM-dependent methyltransferase
MSSDATPHGAQHDAEQETLASVEMPPDLAGVDYGLDSPFMVKMTAFLGGLTLFICFLLRGPQGASFASAPFTAVRWGGFLCLAQAGLMWWSSRSGKLQEREDILLGLQLQGHERALDIGCGRGLMMIGAAKLLPKSLVTGLDCWRTDDLSDNWAEGVWDNARAEGVEDRIEVRDGDMRQMPFPDGSFDVVVSSLSISSLLTDPDVKQTIREIARVLRTGGKLALLEPRRTGVMVTELLDAGFRDVKRSGFRLRVFPPARLVTAVKGAGRPSPFEQVAVELPEEANIPANRNGLA